MAPRAPPPPPRHKIQKSPLGTATQTSAPGGKHPRAVTGKPVLYRTRAHQEMRYPNVAWRRLSSSLYTYLPVNHDTVVLPEYFLSRPNDNCYISNGRRFTKRTLRILLLSNFRVSSINYSPVCSLPIHTRNSTNAEGLRAHCQLTSCKMLHKCSTDCIWKKACNRWMTFKVIQGHCRCCHLIGHIQFPTSLPM